MAQLPERGQNRRVRTIRGTASASVLIAALALGVVATSASPATAEGRTRTRASHGWVVSLGDSYISGEAGRWAGNTNLSPTMTDAGGPGAYSDAPGGESIPRCHRSTSAEIHIGDAPSANLACSGAQTSTFTSSDGFFKPGLDFFDDGAGRKGQALMLQEFAATHEVQMVQVSIGGNNFGFASIVEKCLIAFSTSTLLAPNYCSDDAAVAGNFTPERVAAVREQIRVALSNVRTAMSNAGYTDDRYTIVVQTYPSPLPRGEGIRYGETFPERHSVGGCEFWNVDADWANDVALRVINDTVRAAAASVDGNIRILDIATAFVGRRLCEKGVGTLEEQGLVSWTEPGAVDRTEWVQRIRVETGVSGTPYFIQESLHPNFWGQLALRSCVRQAYNGGSPRGGTCSRLDGLNARGEPNMAFAADPGPAPVTPTPTAPGGPTPAPPGGAFPIPEGTLPETS